MTKQPAVLQVDERQPVRIHPCVFETMVKGLEKSDDGGAEMPERVDE
jgi:hypothetical protein